MNIVPAKVAGVDQIVMTTPPGKDGKVNPSTLVAAKEAGADEITKSAEHRQSVHLLTVQKASQKLTKL